MDECIASAGEAAVFLTLESSQSYWQIGIEAFDTDKTAFTLHHGLYSFIRMPFSLQNAPTNFNVL